jgi:hypothetical protein
MSSKASLKRVNPRTRTKGATYVNINPTFNISINWLKAINRKKRLKKYLN